MEVLRGMKFMQRKEEAKRRTLYEHEQRDQTEHAVRVASGSSDGAEAGKRRPKGPVIIYGHTVPTSAYTLGRRSFRQAHAAIVVDDLLGAPVRSADVEDQDEKPTENIWGDDDATAFVGEAEDPTAATSSCSTGGDRKRFHPSGASRAPKLPKKLTAAVGEMDRQKKKHKMEEANDDF